MALIIANRQQVKEYYDSPALNQSSLKPLLGGLQKALKDISTPPMTEGMVIGSAVDTILLGEDGEFEDLFYIYSSDFSLSDAEKSIVNTVFQSVTIDGIAPTEIKDFKDYPDTIREAIVFHNWWSGDPGEKRIETLIKKSEDYFRFLKESQGKTLITAEQKAIVDTVVENLRTSTRTSSYFDRYSLERSEDVDVYYQYPVYFSILGTPCKALLDMIVVIKNPETKTISTVIPIDLKTTSYDTVSFDIALRAYRYDIQAAWYTEALRNDPLFSNVDIQPFQFVVESTTTPGTPLVFKVTEGVLRMGKEGRIAASLKDFGKQVTYIISKEIKGYEQLLKEYQFYEQTGWKIDYRIKDDTTKFNLGWDGIE